MSLNSPAGSLAGNHESLTREDAEALTSLSPIGSPAVPPLQKGTGASVFLPHFIAMHAPMRMYIFVYTLAHI
jgi:hypothetical protein